MRTLALLLALLVAHAWGAERVITKLVDPAGDDVGDGTLIYPEHGEFRRGTFDLRGLEISRDENGFWFVATFGDFIHEIWWTPGGSGDSPARTKNHRLPFGFNLDLYIDIDRKAESGQMFTLPGRKVRIDRRYAWERAIILSPQPMTVRGKLLAKLRANFPDRPPEEAQATIDATVYFVPRKSIHDKSIRFFVPQEFLGDTDGENWAVTAIVTMVAPLEDDDNLGVRQLAAELTPDAPFSSDPDKVPSPVIDVLLPSAELQYKLLGSRRPLVGTSWGPGTVDETAIEDSVETLSSRLKELKDLLDHRLIGEDHYRTRRAEILGEL